MDVVLKSNHAPVTLIFLEHCWSASVAGYLPRKRASSRAQRRLDSWCPRPAQDPQCLPGQSTRPPQYKYLSPLLAPDLQELASEEVGDEEEKRHRTASAATAANAVMRVLAGGSGGNLGLRPPPTAIRGRIAIEIEQSV